jgi:UDPglucose 6-dehydrogenase
MANICIIGMWHLGCVTAGCLAKYNNIACFDFDKNVIDGLINGKMPIYEPSLQELFKSEHINYFTDLKYCIPDSDYVFITFDTPLDKDNNPILDIIFKTVREIKPYLNKETIVVISSQLPVGTTDIISKKLECKVCYMPENLRLGDAVNCFLNPDFLVFGLSFEKELITKIFSFTDCPKHFLTTREAEMFKHSLNTYLAAMISLSGEISDICEYVGADANKIMSALKSDKRISRFAPIMPGTGFSGGTLERDLQTLKKYKETSLINAVFESNRRRGWKIPYIVFSQKYNTIGILGVTYKKNTDTLRDSPCLDLVKKVKAYDHENFLNFTFFAYDPLFKGKIDGVTMCSSVKEVCENVDIVVIFNDYEEFKEVVDSNVKFIVDVKRLLDGIELKQKRYVIGK